MKVAYVTVSMPFGAVETFLITEAKELVRRGCDLLIVPRSAPSGKLVNVDAEGLETISLRRPLLSAEILRSAALEFLRSPIASLRALGWIFASRNAMTFLKNLSVYPKGLWLGRLARTGSVEHIHAHWASTTATIAMVASEVSGVPWSFTSHRGDIAENNLLATKVRRASFARFISQSGQAMAESLGAECSGSKAAIVHMGVQVPEAAPKAPISRESVRILCPANLLPVKGHEYLLEAIRTLKARGITPLLTIAGKGPLREELERKAEELGISDSVRFVGFVSHDEILRIYENNQTDMVVLASLDLGNNLHEGIPISLVEAMSYGVPTISTTTGGIPELMDGGAGVMVPPANAEALANAIESLVKNPVMTQQVAANSRKRVLEEYSVEDVVSRLIALFQNASAVR